MDLEGLRKAEAERKAVELAQSEKDDQQQASFAMQETVIKSSKALAEYLADTTLKTAVVNQLKEIGTPDALKVVDAVNSLHDTIKKDTSPQHQAKIEGTLETISKTMNRVLDEAEKIPKTHLAPEKQKFIDYSSNMVSLAKAVKAVETAVKKQKTTIAPPKVSLPAPQVSVEAPDLSPLSKHINDVEKAIKQIVIPKTTLDTSKIEKELKSQHKTLKEIRDKPTGGAGGGGRATPYEDSTTMPAFVTLEDDGSIPVTHKGTYDCLIKVNSGDSNITYFGKAVPGTATSAASWQIKEVDTTSGSEIRYADGDANFDNIWDNRESLSY